MMSGYGSFSSKNNQTSFVNNMIELEEEIAETRKELNFAKKEV